MPRASLTVDLSPGLTMATVPPAAELWPLARVDADWQVPVARHHYSLGLIGLCLTLVMHCRASLRGSCIAAGLVSGPLKLSAAVPSHTSVRNWLLRVGLYQLSRPLEQADDWVWIVDHTVQIGSLKCLVIVGFRLGWWQQQENGVLEHQDVELVDLVPIRQSTGKIVDEQLEDAVTRTGVPRLIVSDDGRDLHCGLNLFRERHEEVDWIYDIKHKTASLLKREFGKDAEWNEFVKQANETKRHVHQTELAFCTPPQQRGKARYMNVDVLVAWGQKVLCWMDASSLSGPAVAKERVQSKLGWLEAYREPLARWGQALQVIELVETTVRCQGYYPGIVANLRQQLLLADAEQVSGRLTTALLAFVGEQENKALAHGRLPGSSEVLESVFGKYKALQGDSSHFGVTGMLLSIGAFVGRLTVDTLRRALEEVTAPALKSWETKHLGETVQSQRRQAFRPPPSGTKTTPRLLPAPASG